MGGPLSNDRSQALEPARVVAAAPVLVLDAGVVRPEVGLSRRRAWLRRHGPAADPGPEPPRCRRVDRLGALHRQYGASAPPIVAGHTPTGAPELDHASDPKRLLQFCHGAPGFVVCLADLPSAALDDLLLAAGETIWSAGPLTKGSNLCHGTGGNGYALLKLYRRTRDPLWLERARSFAMHGIAQTQDAASRYGQSRYSLWTGDLGFADLSLGLPARGRTVSDAGCLFYRPGPHRAGTRGPDSSDGISYLLRPRFVTRRNRWTRKRST